MSIHEYLIDDDGKRWCAFDCPAEHPHWKGEPEDEHEQRQAGPTRDREQQPRRNR